MLEVLITALVFAIGLLGLAAMQLAGMKSNYSAYLRSQATFAVYDLLDRMRANPREFVGAAWPLEFQACPDSQVNSFDGWECMLDSLGLPAPVDNSLSRGMVSCGAGNSCGTGNCEIVVRWDDSRGERVGADPSPDAQRTADLEFRVCFRLPEAV